MLIMDMKFVFGLVGFMMVMFLFECICVDVVVLVVLVVLGVIGLIVLEEIFGGFFGNVVMSIIVIIILGVGLDWIGVLNWLVVWLLCCGYGVE